MVKLNIDLAKRLRGRFLRMRHPQHFRMDQIAIKTECGAAMCMIGHILDLEGYKMRPKKGHDPASDKDLFGADDPARSDFDFIHPRTGEAVYEPLDEAQNRIGLNYEDANALFTDFSIKTPKQAAERIQILIESAEVSQ